MNKIIFDFETNDLLSNPLCQPIQFAYIIADKDNNILEKECVYIKLSEFTEINPKALEVHKITKDKLDLEGIEMIKFIQLLNHCFQQSNLTIIGHNIIRFDLILAEKFLPVNIARDFIHDTAAIFKAEKMNQPITLSFNSQKYILEKPIKGLHYNLGLAIEHYGIERKNNDLHDALVDVEYTFEIYKKQLQKMNDSNFNIENKKTILLDTDIMMFGKYKGERLIDIPDNYFKWLYENADNINEDLKEYIKENVL